MYAFNIQLLCLLYRPSCIPYLLWGQKAAGYHVQLQNPSAFAMTTECFLPLSVSCSMIKALKKRRTMLPNFNLTLNGRLKKSYANIVAIK